MQKLLTLVISGAVSGTVYSLIASGLVLSYAATGVFNLAYGGVAFTSAYVYYELHVGLHWPVLPAAAMTLLVYAPLLGLLLDVAVFRALARASDSAKIMATVGLLVALPALARWLVESAVSVFDWHIPIGDQVYVPPGIGPSPKHTWRLPGSIAFDSNQLIVLIAAATVAVALWYVLRRTRMGLHMRAVVDRPALAELRRVDPARTSATAWILGTMLAALAGVVGAPVLGSLEPSTYTFGVFIATAAAVVGRLRSIPLAFVGGMVLGALQNIVAGYFTFVDIQGFGSSVPFLFLLFGLVLLARDRRRVGGTASEEVPPAGYTSDLSPVRRWAPWAVALAFLVVYIGFLADDFWVGLTARGLVMGLIFLSFVIVTGVGGMVSLAQAAFVTVAGLMAGAAIVRWDMPFLVALLIGTAAAVAVGVLVALPAMRLGGLPLALATLALAFVGDKVLFQWDWLRNGQQGWRVPRPSIGPLDLGNERVLAYFVLVVLGITIVLIRNVQRSSTGRAMVAVRTSAPAAATSGISTVRVKLALFALSATIAGIGGVLLASYNESVTSQTTPATLGLIWLANVVLFGIRRPGGAVIAGLTSVMFPQVLSGGIHWPGFVPDGLSWGGTRSIWVPSILFGLGAIQLARDPDGILATTGRQNHARRLAKRARRATAATAATATATAATAPAAAAAVVAAEESATAMVAFDPTEAPMAAGLAALGPVVEDVGADRPAVLALAEVRAGYGTVEVLHGVDLSLRAGEVVALLGVNGAGKSTLCATIAGALPIESGALLFEGRPVTRLPAHKRARAGIALAPESRGVFPSLTVGDNLALWLERDDEIEQVYQRFPQLDARRTAFAGDLSGGEQQILTLAPILVRPPAVIVADEPTLGLAPLVAQQVIGLFAELRDAGCAVLLVEEKARHVLDVADRVAFLELGRVTWIGPRAGLDEERLAAAYLGAARMQPDRTH